jgi:type II secretion system protein N
VPRKIARWKLAIAYTAFGLVAFVLFFFWTFPYEALRQRVTLEASKAGWDVTMTSLGPGLFGVTARNVRIEKSSNEAPVEGAQATEPLVIPAVTLRPSLFPVGVAFSAEVFGGNVSGAVGGLGSASVRLELDGLDPEKGNLKAFSGVDLGGKINGALRLTIPTVKNGPTSEYDFSQANGTLSLEAKNLVVKGGEVTVPYMGTPTPIGLPRVAVGDLTAKVKFEKGSGSIEEFSGKSDDLEVHVDGTLKLARRPEYSETNLQLRLRASPDLVKNLGIVGSGLSMMPADPRDPNFRTARITGFIGRPSFSTR